MRKGQLANQVFIYLMAAIIFSMVIIYGYRAVNDFVQKSEYVALIDFKSEIESSINGIAPTQDRMEKTFTIPGEYEQICFLDMRKGGYDNCTDSGKICYQAYHGSPRKIPGLVYNAWMDNITENIFLLPWADLSIKTTTIELLDDSGNDQGYLCMNISRGKIKLGLKGKGDRTQIQGMY